MNIRIGVMKHLGEIQRIHMIIDVDIRTHSLLDLFPSPKKKLRLAFFTAKSLRGQQALFPNKEKQCLLAIVFNVLY